MIYLCGSKMESATGRYTHHAGLKESAVLVCDSFGYCVAMFSDSQDPGMDGFCVRSWAQVPPARRVSTSQIPNTA